MKLVIGSDPYLRAAAAYIRYQVFVMERDIAAPEEFDANDLPDTVYAVMFDGDEPVSTARYLYDDKEGARITRVATLNAYRGQQLGSQVIAEMEQYILADGHPHIIIHSEMDALPFYQKCGYAPFTEIYYEDGVPCQSVEKHFD